MLRILHISNLANPLFPNHINGKAIKRGWVWKIISSLYKEVGLVGNYGTHRLRKTWGNQARLSWVDIAIIMNMLNHNSSEYANRYLGITDAEIIEFVKHLNLLSG